MFDGPSRNDVEVAATATPPAPTIRATAAIALVATIRDSAWVRVEVLYVAASGNGPDRADRVNARRRLLAPQLLSLCGRGGSGKTFPERLWTAASLKEVVGGEARQSDGSRGGRV